MKILVIGSGGREHALVWKLAGSPRVKKIYAAPGNPGIAQQAECLAVRTDDLAGLLAAAKGKKVDLAVIGPELPLTLGIVDLFVREKMPVFGPCREAARLEGSKRFAKELLREARVPTAAFEVFSDYDRAVEFLSTQAYPVVVKADGLAAGKGVSICRDRGEAVRALDLVLRRKFFGEAGREVVIEEFLEGEEASFQVLVDGASFLPLASAQDHKRVFDGDEGPNTGGMGAFSPTPRLSAAVEEAVLREIVTPTLGGLRKRGIEFRGVLYVGLMLTASGPKVLEFNVRFGDPEAQAVLVRLESDLVDLVEAAVSGTLSRQKARWKPESAVCVVMAARGYPGDVRKGDEITGIESAGALPHTVVFHAGTGWRNNHWVTAGGRVLGMTSWGKDLREARVRAYDACDKIYWKGVHYRKDIGGFVTGHPAPKGR